MSDIAERIIKKYYTEGSLAFNILYAHVVNVTKLALKIAEHNKHLKPDLEFIRTASMLHDIGIFKTHAPDIGCHGELPYLAHTYLGRELLENEGLKEIAPVCERHVGVGISKEDIKRDKLPLPHRDMLPISTEEKIICYADKFFSKNPKKIHKIKSTEKILKKLAKHGDDKVKVFRGFMDEFGWDYIK